MPIKYPEGNVEDKQVRSTQKIYEKFQTLKHNKHDLFTVFAKYRDKNGKAKAGWLVCYMNENEVMTPLAKILDSSDVSSYEPMWDESGELALIFAEMEVIDTREDYLQPSTKEFAIRFGAKLDKWLRSRPKKWVEIFIQPLDL